MNTRTQWAQPGLRSTVEEVERDFQLVSSGRANTVDILDPAGTVRGTVFRDPESRVRIEVLSAVSGLAVIVTQLGGNRYLCFPGSALALEGCSVQLSADERLQQEYVPPSRATQGLTSSRTSVTHQAAIMAGGLATRFAPISGPRTGYSKPGVPIAQGASIIRTIVDNLAAIGITDVFINTHFAARRLMEGLEGAAVRLHFLHEPTPSGTAGPIRKALQKQAYPAFDPSSPLLVMQGDALTDMSLDGLLAAHRELETSLLTIATQLVASADVPHYGIIATDRSCADGQAGRVERFLEKPSLRDAGDNRLASTGVYVLSPALYPLVLRAYELRAGETHAGREPELDFAHHVFPLALHETQRATSRLAIHAFLTADYWNDVGTPQRYFQAIRDVRAGRVRLYGGFSPAQMDATGVVYWGDASLRAERTACLSGNIVAVPNALYAPGVE